MICQNRCLFKYSHNHLATKAKAEVESLVTWIASLTYGSEMKRGSCSLRKLTPSILPKFNPA
jgi:hypothetical protein